MKVSRWLWFGVLLAATPVGANAQDAPTDSLQATPQEAQPQRPQPPRPVSMAPT